MAMPQRVSFLRDQSAALVSLFLDICRGRTVDNFYIDSTALFTRIMFPDIFIGGFFLPMLSPSAFLSNDKTFETSIPSVILFL